MQGRAIGAAAVLAALAGPALGQARAYEVEVVTTWSTATHPGAFPDFAHLSHFGGSVHGAGVTFWEVGEVASPGIKRMAETGSIATLDDEVLAAVDDGTALSLIWEMHWFCPPETVHGSCGEPVFTIEATPEFPLVSVVSMLGPSPDWFVGVNGLSLRDAGGWIEEVVVDLRPYDGGTRSNDASFDLFGPLNDPPAAISVITETSGQVVTGASLGTMTFRLVALECPADFDGDGVVGAADLATLLAAWGGAGAADFDGGGVGAADLAVLLAAWGACG